MAEIGLPVVPALGQLEVRQVILAELKLHVAQLSDLVRIFDGLRAVGEEGGHLLLGFDVKFVGAELHSPRVVQGLAHLDAHEDVLHLRILPAEIVGVVGGDEGDARLLVDAAQPGVHLLLRGDAVVLKLQIIAVGAEEGLHLQRHGLGLVILPGQQQPGQLPRQTGRAGDQPAAVLPQQVHVDAGLDVKALQKGLGDHIGQVAIALLVAAEEDQMAGLGIKLVGLLEPGAAPGGHIHLAANDGLDALGLTGPVEVDDAVHHPVVGDGHRRLAQLLHPLDQLFDAARPVQQGELGMQM